MARDQLTIHADRGSSIASKPVAFLLADLGVTKSHSRPHYSNDNSYSEAQFKTLKYRLDFPDRFGSIHDARAFFDTFYRWYNDDHRHSGIAMHTPFDVHHDRVEAVHEARADVLSAAYAASPNASSANPRNRCHCHRSPGSTGHRHRPPRFNNHTRTCPEEVDRFRPARPHACRGCGIRRFG